jgi:hypothetical protein
MKARYLAQLGDQPSTRLRIVAGYFTLTGSVSASVLVVTTIVGVTGVAPSVGAAVLAPPLRYVGGALTALAWLWTGALLRNKQRSGWLSALATIAIPLVAAAFRQSLAISAVVTGVVGIALLFSIRGELE